MRDECLWLALGAAIGNKQMLARLLAEVPAAAFGLALQAQLHAALGRGREEVRAALARMGVECRPERSAADALLDAARASGEKEAQLQLARRLDLAARMMSPAEFRAYAAGQLAALDRPETPAAPERNGKALRGGPAVTT